jgi:hypothetical protein
VNRLLLLIAVVLGALSLATVALAAPPATMSGENLTATGGPFAVACSVSGTFPFAAAGAATGPYAGTFTESGTVSFSVPLFGPVTAFSADFVITSATGDVLVRGTKTLDTGVPNTSDACADGHGNLGVHSLPATYDATIFTAAGNFHDMGTSFVSPLFSNGSASSLGETFLSSLSAPVLIAPTGKDQCKDGGWLGFPQFKNQGDCVSYVATGGKNPPAH